MFCGLLALFCACTATRVELIRDGEFHTLRIPVSQPGYRKGRLNVIRFDFFTAAVPGDAIDIRSISPVK